MADDKSNLPQRSGASAVGRGMPHSVEAEEYLLSCCLIDGAEVVARCLEARISPDSFYVPAHGIVFEKLLDLYGRQVPIDVAVLGEELKTSKQLDSIGGYAFLTRVSGSIPTTAQAGYFIERVREQHLLREIIRSATGAVEECFNFTGGIDEFVDQVEARIFAVTQSRVNEGAKPMSQPTKEAMNIVYKMMPKKGEAFATLIFSLEMSGSQLALRMLCSRARVKMQALRDGILSKNGDEQQRLVSAADEFSKAPLYIDDSSNLSIMQLRAKARRVHSRHKLGLIIVDYLQLLSPVDSKVPREQQVAEASRGLKALAKELDVPVVVLSQLNRSSEKENRAPKLADLRESGSIEQDADVVLMLARPKDADEKYQVAADSAELIVAKQRNGPVGELRLTFLRDITRIENYTQ